MEETVGPVGLSDDDCGGNANVPPNGYPRKSSLSLSTIMRRLNEAAETI